MKTSLRPFVALLLAASQILTNTAIAATSANSTAKQIVQQQISILYSADLDFGTALQGAGSAVVAPADGGAALFDISGTASATYSVVLPSTDLVLEIAGGSSGDPLKEIIVNAFTKTSATGGASPALNGSGTDVLKVGATRAALPANQVPGSYSKVFPVSVAYL